MTRVSGLPGDVGELLRRRFGVLTSAEAQAAGVGRARLYRLERTGLLTQLGRGCYADTALLRTMNPWDRHRLAAKAFAIACGSDAYLIGWSAVVSWRLPTMGSPPVLPTAVRPRVAGRGPSVTPYGRIRVAELAAEHRIRDGRWGLMSQEWTVVDLARSAPLHHALVVADQVVRNDRDLASAVRYMHRWPGAQRSRWIAENADRNSESALETLGRFTCIEFNLPMPVSNAWVGRDGPEKRVDGLWPYHGAVFEADGAVKYDNAATHRRSFAHRTTASFTCAGWR